MKARLVNPEKGDWVGNLIVVVGEDEREEEGEKEKERKKEEEEKEIWKKRYWQGSLHLHHLPFHTIVHRKRTSEWE